MDEIPLFCDSNDDCQMYPKQGVCCGDKVPPKVRYPQGLNPPKGICLSLEICLENDGIHQEGAFLFTKVSRKLQKKSKTACSAPFRALRA